MKIAYTPESDVLKIRLNNIPVAVSDETKPGMILEYDKDGNLVGMEISNASQHLDNPYAVEYIVTPTNQPILSLSQRRAFMQLPLSERRRLLLQQAEKMVQHYQQNQEWQELLAGDIIDY